jgi:hypothetical protein
VASTSSAPSPSPSPTPAPLVCPPVKPSIISQEIPSIPSPPMKPNVPLPASWTDVP